MAFDATKPVDDSPLDAAEMRGQLNALKALIDAQQAQIADLQSQVNQLRAQAALMPHLTEFDTAFHSPPTEADLEAIRNYVNDMASQLQGGW